MARLSSDYSIRGFRRRLASIEAMPQFAILGIVSGIVTGLVIVVFRALVEIPLSLALPGGAEQDFESLERAVQFLLPVAGAVVLAIAFVLIRRDRQEVGVVHVLQRLSRHQGHLPLGNALVQFLAGAVALLTGQSSGREGPAIHLGAACSSLVGQSLRLPNNSIRVLVGCGAAAAISASFNTPIAGVIFSMEVIMMEYSIAGFIPVILAAVVATLINQIVYGRLPAFDIPPLAMKTLYDVAFVIVEGIIIGCLAAAFIHWARLCYRHAPKWVWLKLPIAGFVTGALALIAPEILGIGYDTVDEALLGKIGFASLVVLCLLKLLASATSVGLGMPAGLIGPVLFIGAMAGGALGVVGNSLLPETSSSPGFYVMLGMGAMMGAVLQAPLSALLAVVELTLNPNIVLPAMLAIVIANLTASQGFRCKGLFLMQMEMMGFELRQNPLSLALDRASVASIMERDFNHVAARLTLEESAEALDGTVKWLIVEEDGAPSFVVPPQDLADHLANPDLEDVVIDLRSIPARRLDATPINLQATLKEALDRLNETGAEALLVYRIGDTVAGILTRSMLDAYYQR